MLYSIRSEDMSPSGILRQILLMLHLKRKRAYILCLSPVLFWNMAGLSSAGPFLEMRLLRLQDWQRFLPLFHFLK